MMGNALRLLVCLFVSVSFYFLSGRAFAAHLINVDAALRNVFPTASSFEAKSLVLSAEEIVSIVENADVVFDGALSAQIITYTAKEGSRIVGYAFEDTVIGKWGPIHYLVGLDLSGAIVQAVILDYKEIRGRPISKKRFLNQYKGKTVYDRIILRSDIDGITGATISSRSLTDGVRKILHINGLIRTELSR